MTFVLASRSPRRIELLLRILPEFTLHPVDADETLPSGALEDGVVTLATRKALMCAAECQNAIILAADTLVCVDGQALGKPRDAEDAVRMLSLLSGRWHEVHTGLCLLVPGMQTRVACETSRVHFDPWRKEDIIRYVASGEPMDKAGAYAIQGGAQPFTRAITGSYTSIIGLPLSRVRSWLNEIQVLSV